MQQLNAWVNEIAGSDDMKPALVASGSMAGKGSAGEAQQFIEADIRKWKELAKASKLAFD